MIVDGIGIFEKTFSEFKESFVINIVIFVFSSITTMKHHILSFDLGQIKVNAVTPLVLLGSYWYDEPFKTARFYGDEDRTIEMSSPIMKLIPHCYVLGIKVEQLYKTYNAVPTQSQSNKSIPLTGGGSK